MTYSGEFPFTFLSLARYANLLGFDPIQFFQGKTSLRASQNCTDVFYQFAWQNDSRVSREELRQATRQSEDDLIKEIRYYPAPYWYTEVVPYKQFYQKEYRGVSGLRVGGFNYKTVHTKMKHVISGGIRATSQIDSGDIVKGSDIDTTGDGFDDTAVFTVTVDFTDVCELKAYFKEYSALDVANTRTDPGSTGADTYWEIRPIRSTLSGTTATVYIPVYLLFKPQLQRQIDVDNPIDADVSASYVDTIEFYRVYNDPSTQATFLWTTESSCSDVGCAWSTQSGCMRVQDSRRGIVTVAPSTWNATTETFSSNCFTQNREPDKVILYYYSGKRDPTARNCDELSYFWAYTIAMLASARLNKTICTCESPARIIERWQEDLAMINDVRSYNINIADLSNPFGTKYGEVLTYNRIKGRGIKVGQNITTY